MKNIFVRTIVGVVGGAKRIPSLLLAVLLCAAVFWLCGCEQPGETVAKGDRRHQRNLSVNQESFNSDLDRALLFDRPSRLTDTKMPPPIDK